MIRALLNKLRGEQEFAAYRVQMDTEPTEPFAARVVRVQGISESAGTLNPFSLFERLIEGLRARPQLQVVPLGDFASMPNNRGVRVALRFDLDDDPATGLRAARHLARFGLPGQFFVLHTSKYYVRVVDGVRYRNPELVDLVRGFLVAGAELGLHVDALALYQQGIDGAEAVKTEIAWLRSLGAEVPSVCAHNAACSYGAENFEVFRELAAGGRRSVKWNGERLPLQVLDMDELGLRYEANLPLPRAKVPAQTGVFFEPPPDAVRDPEWLRAYLIEHPVFERGYEVSVWLLGADQWAIARHGEDGALEWPVDLDRVFEFLTDLDGARDVVFVLHPEYFAG